MQLFLLFREKRSKVFLYAGVVLLIHAFKFTNYLPTWDSIDTIILTPGFSLRLGRPFSNPTAILLHSFYDLQWVEGVFSAVFLGLTIAIFLDLFDIRDRVHALCAAFLFAAFPSVAAVFVYSAWAPAFMLALLMAFAAVYLCWNGTEKWEFALSACLFAGSWSIYQVYCLTALTLFLYCLADRLMEDKIDWADFRRKCLIFAASFFAGGLLYLLFLGFCLAVTRLPLSPYQGISEIGIMSLSRYLLAIAGSLSLIRDFFFAGNGIYALLNGAFFLGAAVLAVRVIFQNSRYGSGRKAAVCLLLLSALPVTYAFRLLSPGVQYHRLMEMGNYFVYFSVLVLLKHRPFSRERVLRPVIVTLLAVLCFYHFLNDNIAYHQMSMSWNKTIFDASTVVTEIDRLRESDATPVAIIGSFPTVSNTIRAVPSITGATTANIIYNPRNFSRFAKHYLGREITLCEDPLIEYIKKQEEFQNMPQFPHTGYAGMIDGVLVIKLSV